MTEPIFNEYHMSEIVASQYGSILFLCESTERMGEVQELYLIEGGDAKNATFVAAGDTRTRGFTVKMIVMTAAVSTNRNSNFWSLDVLPALSCADVDVCVLRPPPPWKSPERFAHARAIYPNATFTTVAPAVAAPAHQHVL